MHGEGCLQFIGALSDQIVYEAGGRGVLVRAAHQMRDEQVNDQINRNLVAFLQQGLDELEEVQLDILEETRMHHIEGHLDNVALQALALRQVKNEHNGFDGRQALQQKVVVVVEGAGGVGDALQLVQEEGENCFEVVDGIGRIGCKQPQNVCDPARSQNPNGTFLVLDKLG